jgi:hypothetical protein
LQVTGPLLVADRAFPQKIEREDDVDQMNFDLEPLEVQVTVGGKSYVLREASEDAACKWRNKIMSSTKLTDGKPSSIDGIGDSEPLLVSLCLWEQHSSTKDEVKQLKVPLEVVRSWPSRVVKKLHKWVMENSDLEEKPKTRTEIEKAISDLNVQLKNLEVPEGNG